MVRSDRARVRATTVAGVSGTCSVHDVGFGKEHRRRFDPSDACSRPNASSGAMSCARIRVGGKGGRRALPMTRRPTRPTPTTPTVSPSRRRPIKRCRWPDAGRGGVPEQRQHQAIVSSATAAPGHPACTRDTDATLAGGMQVQRCRDRCRREIRRRRGAASMTTYRDRFVGNEHVVVRGEGGDCMLSLRFNGLIVFTQSRRRAANRAPRTNVARTAPW